MMARSLLLALALAVTPPSADAEDATLDRELHITLTVDASQTWKNVLQWGQSHSTQRYEITTALRSDGRLYHDNLVDVDIEQRLSVKRDYYTYQGLLQLKKEHGGRLPKASEVSLGISANPNQQVHCLDSNDCPYSVAERAAAIVALQNNTVAELEAFIASYDEPGGRYLYFFGYAGCPNRLSLQHRSHFEGEQAFDHDRKKLIPFQLDWNADSTGSDEDRPRLCQRYVISLDFSQKLLYVETGFIPSPRGTSVRILGKKVERSEAELPVPHEVLDWVGERLRKTSPTGSATSTLVLTWPLDGNATVLGAFDGRAKVTLSWAFLG